MEKIKKSIDIILNSGKKYEFRTTVYPKYVHKENVITIAKYLKVVGAKEYVLQNYYDYNGLIKPYSRKELEEMREACNVYLSTKLKGII